jgi:hypothetical protein
MNATHIDFAYISCDIPAEMTLTDYRRSIVPEPHGLRAALKAFRHHERRGEFA